MPSPIAIDPALRRRVEEFCGLPRGRVQVWLAGGGDRGVVSRPDAGTVLFHRRPDFADPAWRGVLAHEFWHAAQFAAGAGRPGAEASVPALEWQASLAETGFGSGLVPGPALPAPATAGVLRWGPAGHYYTAYLCALMAGISPPVAFKLAFFCQMTDQVAEFDAISMVKAYGKRLAAASALKSGPFIPVLGPSISIAGGIAGTMLSDVTREQMDVVHIGLHCLTGGPSAKATRVAGTIIKDWSFSIPMCGAAIHLYGDSFAHRVISNGDFMYGPGTGHAVEYPKKLDGHEPDYCSEHETYPEYYQTLHAILSQLPFATGKKFPDIRAAMTGFPTKHNEQAEIDFLRAAAKRVTGTAMSDAYRPEQAEDAIPFADFAAAFPQFLAGESVYVDRVMAHARRWKSLLQA